LSIGQQSSKAAVQKKTCHSCVSLGFRASLSHLLAEA